MQHTPLKYQDQSNTSLHGHLYYSQLNRDEKLPAVIVVHDWSGCNDFAKQQAQKIAANGYIGFAIDMYGEGKVGNSMEEKAALMQPVKNNRVLLQQRIAAAVTALQQQPNVDVKRIAAIGFCFGGLCVLDLARTHQNIKGVASFHGLLQAPDNNPNTPISSKVLVLHGYADPMVQPQDLIDFAKEMTERHADWQIHAYGHTVHAFTNPEAKDDAHGLRYNALAAQRSWLALQNFLTEIF